MKGAALKWKALSEKAKDVSLRYTGMVEREAVRLGRE